jgi:Lrp/AsnC family transcriptional regulator, leucine-responsive regulatory protein
MNTHRELDEIDIKLIDVLQVNGRMRRNALAEVTGLSVPAVSERMKKLEEAGIISGYRAIIDWRRVGWDITSFIVVTVDSSKHYKSFLGRVEATEEIVECHAITGEGTHLIKVRAKNAAALEGLLSKIQSWQGVIQTMTRVVLSTPKETTGMPISDKK